jgi:hypothetical protein
MRSGPPLHAHDAMSQPCGALTGPTFWVALCVLALNDHVLKASGWCPSWLTGKLSDFAGLVVAPVLAAELCRGRLAPLRLLAACSVVCAFAATELSSAAAAWVGQSMAGLGIPMRLWADPTDLLALTVLPWTFRLLRQGGGVPARRTLWQRVGLALAAATCLATSPIPEYRLGAFLVNHSGATLTVEVRWFDRPDACAVSLRSLNDLLANATPMAERRVRLATARTLRLDVPDDPAAGNEGSIGCFEQVHGPVTVDAGPTGCVLLQVSTDELPPHWVRADGFWIDSTSSRCGTRIPSYDHPGDGAVVLGRRSDGHPSLTALGPVEVLADAQ